MIRKLFLRRMQRHTSRLEEKSSLRQMVGKTTAAPRQPVRVLIHKGGRRLRCDASTIGFRWFAKRSLVRIIAHVFLEVQHAY
jgi:hypothetical protein